MSGEGKRWERTLTIRVSGLSGTSPSERAVVARAREGRADVARARVIKAGVAGAGVAKALFVRALSGLSGNGRKPDASSVISM